MAYIVNRCVVVVLFNVCLKYYLSPDIYSWKRSTRAAIATIVVCGNSSTTGGANVFLRDFDAFFSSQKDITLNQGRKTDSAAFGKRSSDTLRADDTNVQLYSTAACEVSIPFFLVFRLLSSVK